MKIFGLIAVFLVALALFITSGAQHAQPRIAQAAAANTPTPTTLQAPAPASSPTTASMDDLMAQLAQVRRDMATLLVEDEPDPAAMAAVEQSLEELMTQLHAAGSAPMDHTMPMTGTHDMPAPVDHAVHHMQHLAEMLGTLSHTMEMMAAMHVGAPMTGDAAMPADHAMHQPGMAPSAAMSATMPMTHTMPAGHETMDHTMPMTHTMPMAGGMDHSQPMTVMMGDMTAMMQRMAEMHRTMMGDGQMGMGDMGMMPSSPMTSTMPMMGQMMGTMGQMMQMMGRMQAQMGMPDMPMGHTMPMTDTMPMASQMMEMTGQMMQMMGQMHMQMGSGGMGMMGSGGMDMMGSGGMGMMGSGGMGMMGSGGMGMMGSGGADSSSSMCKSMMDKGCEMMKAATPVTTTTPLTTTTPVTGSLPTTENAAPTAAQPAGLQAQTAEAGAVTITLTPRNLTDPAAQTLDFDVALNTHSVDLSGDLAKLAVLRAGTNRVAATSWNAPTEGGHHVMGVLSFPAVDASGEPILQGVKTIVVTIRNLAAVPLRAFTWTLQ